MRCSWSLVTAALGIGCAGAVPATLPDPNADVGLGEVAFLTWTTRSASGVLGHVQQADSALLDPHRKVVDGTATFTPTDQRLVLVVEQTLSASANAGTLAISGGAAAKHATHVAYDVRISGYLELAPEQLKYAAKSGCCQGGGVSAACGPSYVSRLMRGSGKVQYLQRLDASAEVSAAEIVRAQGGTTYRRLNESTFEDAFFAYQLVPLSSLCSHLSPEEELETLAVRPPDNCWVQAYGEDGRREARAFHVPDASLCRKLAEHHCQRQEKLAGCSASFGRDGSASALPLFEAAAALPVATQPAGSVAEPPPVPAPTPDSSGWLERR